MGPGSLTGTDRMLMRYYTRLLPRNRVLVNLGGIVAVAIALNIALQNRPRPEAEIVFHETPRAVAAESFMDGRGRPVAMADFRGKVVVLNIWATWCLPCIEEMPSLDNLQATLGGEDFQVVALSIDKTGLREIEYFFGQYELNNLTIYRDEEQKLYDRLAVVAIPTSLIIDRQGFEIGRMIGPATWDSDRMIATLFDIIKQDQP